MYSAPSTENTEDQTQRLVITELTLDVAEIALKKILIGYNKALRNRNSRDITKDKPRPTTRFGCQMLGNGMELHIQLSIYVTVYKSYSSKKIAG